MSLNAIFLLLLHLLTTAVYAAVMGLRQRTLGIAKAVLWLCLPLVGPAMLLITDGFFLLKRRRHYDYSQLISEDDTELISEYRENADEVLVPIEDVLYISNAATKRKVLLNVLKKDTHQFISHLKTALADDDTETSHYAAAAMVETKGEYDKKIAACLRLEEEEGGAEPVYQLIEVLYEYMSLDILDYVNEQKYAQLLVKKAEKAQREFGELPFDSYQKYASTLFRTDHPGLEKILLAFEKSYPDREQPYQLLLDYYYQQRDQEGIRDTLERLGRSKTLLSREMLELVRFYRNGDEAVEI